MTVADELVTRVRAMDAELRQMRAHRDRLQSELHDFHLRLFTLSAEWGRTTDENRKRAITDERIDLIKRMRRVEDDLNEVLHDLRQHTMRRLELKLGGEAHPPSNIGL